LVIAPTGLTRSWQRREHKRAEKSILDISVSPNTDIRQLSSGKFFDYNNHVVFELAIHTNIRETISKLLPVAKQEVA
jgi:hypothetical protein